MLETGALAPHFTLLATDGREYSLPGGLSSEPLVLVFLKTGCAACDVAMPYLNNLHAAYPRDGWHLWSIIQEPPEKARDYLAKYKATYPFLIDAAGWDVSRLYDPPATPTIFIVEPSGRVAYTTYGFSKEDLNHVSARVAAYLQVEPVEVAPLGDGHPDFRPGCVPRHLMPSRPSR